MNYSANITNIIDFYNVTKEEAGMAPTFFFFAYGVGQVVNGLLCKKYNIKWMVFGSLITSSSINYIIAICSNFAIIKWLWMVNGFALSILWPSLIRLLSKRLPQKDLSKSSAVMGTTVATGTLVIYILSSVYTFFGSFKLAFYTAAVADIIVAFFWLVYFNKSVKFLDGNSRDDYENKEAKPNTVKEEQTRTERILLYISVYVLCFCAVGINLIKDGLTTWVPSILKDECSVTDSLSILLTVFLPMVAIFGTLFALITHKKIPDYVTHCAVIFIVIFGFIGIILGGIRLKAAAVMLFGLITVSFLVSSLNNLVTSIFPMFMRERINSGLYAGVLNGFCYLGSAISSYGLGFIADKFGWEKVFWVLMAFCAMII